MFNLFRFTALGLTPIVVFNLAMFVVFTVAFFYQIVFLFVGRREPPRGEEPPSLRGGDRRA